VHFSTRLFTVNSAGQPPLGIALLQEAFLINEFVSNIKQGIKVAETNLISSLMISLFVVKNNFDL